MNQLGQLPAITFIICLSAEDCLDLSFDNVVLLNVRQRQKWPSQFPKAQVDSNSPKPKDIQRIITLDEEKHQI